MKRFIEKVHRASFNWEMYSYHDFNLSFIVQIVYEVETIFVTFVPISRAFHMDRATREMRVE